MKWIVLVCALTLAAGCTKDSSERAEQSIAPTHQAEKERQVSQTENDSTAHDHEEDPVNGEERPSKAE